VSTYGVIADEHQMSARQVAQIMSSNEDDIPWQRVIKSDGTVPMHGSTSEQVMLLRDEGLEVANRRVLNFKERLFLT
jgi:alkylated DNA nucleotide flippase Atl1